MWRSVVCYIFLAVFRRHVLPPSSGQNSRSSDLKTEIAGSSETVVNIYQTMLSHITEDSSVFFLILRCDNLQDCTGKVLFEVFVCLVMYSLDKIEISHPRPCNTDKTLRIGFVIEGLGVENERRLLLCMPDGSISKWPRAVQTPPPP
jgi:hypothetical protein